MKSLKSKYTFMSSSSTKEWF